MEISSYIKKIIFETIKERKIKIDISEIRLEHPADNKFGDYSTNIAMVLAKQNNLNPINFATEISDLICLKNSEFIEKVEVAGSGFINFYLKFEYLTKKAEELNYRVEFINRLNSYGSGKTMVIDYSGPNIAKPFGIGHLRSTNIGQSLYNIYKILGWACIGDNYIGDWGTQYGKLMTAIQRYKDQDPRFLIKKSKFDLKDLTIDDLEKLYVVFHKEAKNDEKLIEEGRSWFAKLEKGDQEAREIWQECVKISLLEFNKIYQLLGVKIDFVHGESFYEKMLPQVSKEVIEKGITKNSQGAIIVEFPNMPPAMLQKTNKTTTYFTRDLAAIKYRLNEWKPDLIIYEVGVDQQLHFQQLFKTVEMLAWGPKTKLVHVAHGLIRWPSGKFSTRKGETIHLSEVIERAIEKSKEITETSSVNKKISEKEKGDMVKKVAIGAIKFSDLISDPKKDIIFDWEKVMSLEGDSGPYLQYTYARCKSVLLKTKVKETKNINKLPDYINDDEQELIREFYKFEEKIIEASNRFSPSVIAEYLLVIARKYNEFYAKNRIINEKEEVFRLFLTQTTVSILEMGLGLLGIETMDKM